uniref:NADH dehydrogenase subunit 6 n=1 Tax=Haltichella nipponensis TaxID=2907788 RepID=UPI001EDD9321|nr:NADH dehydrogenase subunit 6 [Haltichella nipponensis]UIB40566.1 NADH dehydrogenase subunit 6 [Haltichella nipponensis]
MFLIIFILNFFPMWIYYSKKMNPMMFMIILLMFVNISSLNFSNYYYLNLYSFLMYLIIIGGMMIIFMYFISTMNNVKMSINFYSMIMNLTKFILMIISSSLFINKLNYFISYPLKFNLNSMMDYLNLNKLNSYFMNNIYLDDYYWTTMMMMIYLMYVMIFISKMFMVKKKSIRKMNNYEKISI